MGTGIRPEGTTSPDILRYRNSAGGCPGYRKSAGGEVIQGYRNSARAGSEEGGKKGRSEDMRWGSEDAEPSPRGEENESMPSTNSQNNITEDSFNAPYCFLLTHTKQYRSDWRDKHKMHQGRPFWEKATSIRICDPQCRICVEQSKVWLIKF